MEEKNIKSNDNLHNQRLMSLGILAGGVAHDFNNILTGIMGHIDFIKRNLKTEDKDVLDSAESIENAVLKASCLTKQILNFSRLKLNEERKPLNLSKVIEDTVFLLRASIPPIYELETNLESDIYISAIEASIGQILINLVINAKDALGEKGKIEVLLKKLDDKNCAFSVKDNGKGIPENLKSKILEAYFTTKGDHGTGLGLYTVSKIVKEFDGTLKIESKEGEGSEFIITFPLDFSQAKDISQNNESEKQEEKKHAKVLFVDDEETIREVFSAGLDFLGYEVVVADGVESAYQIYKKERGNFDIVVSDMLMPDGSGEDLFIDLMSIKPEVKFIVISGFSSQDAVKKMLDYGAKAFLEKPFTLDALDKKIQEVLK